MKLISFKKKGKKKKKKKIFLASIESLTTLQDLRMSIIGGRSCADTLLNFIGSDVDKTMPLGIFSSWKASLIKCSNI
jgi:hypothetical protein